MDGPIRLSVGAADWFVGSTQTMRSERRLGVNSDLVWVRRRWSEKGAKYTLIKLCICNFISAQVCFISLPR